MPVNLVAPDPASLYPVAGVELGTARAGIRKPGRRDLLVVQIAAGATAAGVFTRNRFCAAPVTAVPRQPRRHGWRAAGGPGQHRLRQRRHREPGLDNAKAVCAAAGGCDRLPRRGSAADVHRRDPRTPAAGSRRGRHRACHRRPVAGELGGGCRGDHDHRHAAEGGLAAYRYRRQTGDGDRHLQGRRHDPPEHGDACSA